MDSAVNIIESKFPQIAAECTKVIPDSVATQPLYWR